MARERIRWGRSRALWVALVAVVSMGLVGAGGAQAAPAPVTQSTITSPSDPFYALDHGQAQNVTISGTSNGTTGDRVSVLCYNDDGSSGTDVGTVQPNIGVNSDGTFSAVVPLSQVGVFNNVCRLRAVPAGTAPTTGLAAFAGPRSLVSMYSPSTDGATTYNYFFLGLQLAGADQYESYGSCGVLGSYLFDPGTFGKLDSEGLTCSDNVGGPGSPTTSQARVDGHPAYPPEIAHALNRGASGLPSATVSAMAQNPSTGDLSFTESEPLAFCAGSPASPSARTCPRFTGSGITLQRAIAETDNGHIVAVQDRFSSNNGAAHTVSLQLANSERYLLAGSPSVSFEFPGQSRYSSHSAGDSVSVPQTAPASILAASSIAPDGATSGGRGAITYGQVPSAPFRFANATTFDAPTTLDVPSAGVVTLRYAYSTEFTQAAVAQDAAAEQALFNAAAIVFTAPAGGTKVYSSPVKVSGRVSAPSGVESVRVNGVAASVTHGSFSASVPLTLGTDPLTATVTAASGAAGSASETVTYVRSAPVATTTKPTAVRMTSARLSGRVTSRSAPTTYRFQYGLTRRYGKKTPRVSLRPSNSSSTARLRVRGLKPHTTYHVRLVATSKLGIAYGRDIRFTTAKPRPRAVRYTVTPGHAAVAPYRYNVNGSITLPAHISRRSGCAGSVSITVRYGRRSALSRRVKVNSTCDYTGTVSFPAAQLPGDGSLRFSLRFLGNRPLGAAGARTVAVRFG